MIHILRLLHLLSAALLLSAAGAAGAASAPTQEELRDLRARISAMQKKLAAAEETKSEASDALRQSELAISTANRELRELGRQARDAGARLAALRKSSRQTGDAVREQQQLLGRMLRQQYLQGQPEALRLVLSREDPNDIARQLHYLAQVARARALMVDSLRANLREIDELEKKIATQVADIARITAEQTAQKKQLEQQKQARAEVLSRVSREIAGQQRQIRAMQANENRLSRLVEQLARVVRKPSAANRPRTDSVPSNKGDGSPFSELRGQLSLPVRGELGNRFGGPRADGGVTWKGLFIAARPGDEVRAVAAGRVVYADWLRGFGNLLIVDHGDNYMTLYAYAEALLRQVGDVIRGGQPVATVGNSGGHPESGLYFEMRHEGKPFDPLAWVRVR